MKKVLVVDDEPYVLKGLAMVVDAWGYCAMTATCAAEALAVVKKNGVPSALVTDYRLRDQETGLDVIQAVRLECGCVVPALLITGDTEPARMACIARTDVPVLHKPVKPERIKAVLDAVALEADEAEGDERAKDGPDGPPSP